MVRANVESHTTHVTEKGKSLTACQTRDEHQQMRVFNYSAADLSSAEDGACGAETPVTAHPKLLDDDVGTNTYTNISVRSVIAIVEAHLLPLARRPTKLQTERIDTCMSCRS